MIIYFFIDELQDEGINHKTYGVTSEGVAVFLDEALKYKKIDPRSAPFTVKITGGFVFLVCFCLFLLCKKYFLFAFSSMFLIHVGLVCVCVCVSAPMEMLPVT
jgi:hypothetical protein